MSVPNCCPLCKSNSNNQSVVTNHVFGDLENKRAFYYCSECDIRYQYPPLSPAEEIKFYNAEFESFMSSRSGESGGWTGTESHINANQSTVSRRMQYLLPELNKGGDILEIGCSSGFMLYPLREKGYNCIGIEPSGFFSEYVRSRDITVFDSIEELQLKSPAMKFDIIMHFFVLEHIAEPLNFLKLQIELLKPGGKIIFEIPNAADVIYSVYDIPAFEKFYWSIAHPWYFSEKSLTYLLNKLDIKFDILFDQRYDLSNHMTWARDGKPGGMGRYTKQLGTELEEFYKKSLIKSKMCDTLIGVITKG
jgi:SAM-dependent methyltransferase